MKLTYLHRPNVQSRASHEETCLQISTEPQKKRRNFNNSIRYGKQIIHFFFKLQVFIATEGVGTHNKKLSNNKLPVHQNFIITHIDNFIV